MTNISLSGHSIKGTFIRRNQLFEGSDAAGMYNVVSTNDFEYGLLHLYIQFYYDRLLKV